MRYRAAVVQATSRSDVDASLALVQARVEAAAEAGAQLIALPEAVHFMGSEHEKAALAEPLEGPTFERLAGWAKTLGVTLAAGSLPERSEDPNRPFNTAVVYGPDGSLWAHYRKIHLFDVDLRPEGPRLAESDRTAPGDEPLLIDSPLGRIGVTICYDLRFPALFEALGAAGAEVILVPSAFTVPTGSDHWEVLLRARAIEQQCYVLAPAQFGRHSDKRQSYGRSMIVDPWGTVLSVVPDRGGPGFALADLDLEALAKNRARMPCREHRRTLRPIRVVSVR